MTALHFPENRPFDAACLGRLAVDLYAQQYGCSLEEASSFAKYLGGSSANIAFGLARLGLRSAMISRVGDEQNGRFLLSTLKNEGCDVSQIQIDRERLTGMVLLGIKDQDTFPLLFARENCADMAIEADGISEDFIAQCRSLVITGTHLSTPKVLAASRRALDYAGKHGVVRVLDIDYRPVLWGLTGRGDGETRYIANDRVSEHLQAQLPLFELIIGTEEEWLIAGGVPGDLIASLQAVRKCTGAVMVVKRGAIGCSIIQGEVPSKLDDALTILGERIEVLNVLGAGDAFASGLLSGLLQGKGFAESARIANACGALVVSRHGCAPAMPCPVELDYWFSSERQSRPDQDPQLAHLHRVGVSRPQWPELYVLAFDHRSQFEDLAQQVGADPQRIAALKRLLVDVVKEVSQRPGMPGKIGLLVDGGRGEAALHQATDCGFWLGRPIELPGSRPLQFDGYRSLASQLLHWPKEQVVKCLVFYDRNDPEAMRQSQDEQLMHVWEATRASGHELLLEIIPPKDRIAPEQSDDSVLDSISHLYALGLKPEWWKVGAMSATAWQRLDTLVRTNDPYCRGAVILGLNQPLDQLVDSFVQAQAPVVKGFMVGRSVWVEPAGLWLSGQIDDQVLRRQVQANFTRLITGWQGSRRPSSDASNATHGVTEKEISE